MLLEQDAWTTPVFCLTRFSHHWRGCGRDTTGLQACAASPVAWLGFRTDRAVTAAMIGCLAQHLSRNVRLSSLCLGRDNREICCDVIGGSKDAEN
ncbi:hypothetical protein RRG08_055441 [Elysia crispata]|uniref:Uncharacterized protein n=1 Tax=Elysia crispata TaxID=231223 RepID=A0AAE1A909_9GAST|nr:hypothetical protein RRG08_055441 [Elysia crispata]